MRRFSEPADLALNLRNLILLAEEKGEQPWLRLFCHPKLGRLLVIDRELQHVEAWQALYHEPLVHLASAFVPVVKKVLILGGGSLFAAREVLRYPTVQRCTLVDHDPRVVRMMVEHYEHARSVISDFRFHYVAADALDYTRSSREAFDLIINDCFDLARESARGSMSYALLSDHLAPGGVCSDMIYRDLLEPGYVTATSRILRGLGAAIGALIFVPEYPGVLHALTVWGSSALDQRARVPLNGAQREWCREGRSGLEFYDPAYLSFHLYLPPLFRRHWDRDLPEEGVPEPEFA